MKKLLTLSLLAALSLGLSTTSFAATKKDDMSATPAPAMKPAASPAMVKTAMAKTGKALPMYSHVDAVDAAAKTFTTKRKDGVEVKHMITPSTEIKNGEATATFADIKVGLYVSGLRLKKSDTTYDVVKITKIAPQAEKMAKEKKAE